MNIGLIVLGVIIVVVAFLFLRASIRIVAQNRDLVVQWLGRYQDTRDAGLRLLIPVIQNGTLVDMRERVKEIPQQTCITRDNAPINIDFLIFSRVLDARASVFEVQNFDDLMLGNHHLRSGGKYQHVWGIGRHLLGSQVFDYWKDPWGRVHEHWVDTDRLTARHRRNLIPAEEGLGSQWGDAAPPAIVGHASP